jgi:hypothetical protein
VIRLFQEGLLVATDSDSNTIFVGVPALGSDYGTFIDLDSRSSFNRLPGFEILQRPVIELLKTSITCRLVIHSLSFNASHNTLITSSNLLVFANNLLPS